MVSQEKLEEIVNILEQSINALIEAQRRLIEEGDYHTQEIIGDAIKLISRARAKLWKNYYAQASKALRGQVSKAR